MLPFHSIFVRLTRRTLRGTDGMQLQQWVLSKEEDEALADRASGSEDAFLVVRESRIPIVQNCLYVPHFFLAKVI